MDITTTNLSTNIHESTNALRNTFVSIRGTIRGRRIR